jgi:hypothetical protein
MHISQWCNVKCDLVPMKTEPPLHPHTARSYSLTARFGGSVRATGHPRINYAENNPQNFSPLLSRTHAARRNYHRHDSIPEQQAGCAILRRCRCPGIAGRDPSIAAA